jgi:hypothetical protein
VDHTVAARQTGFGPERILLVISVSKAYQYNNSGITYFE